MNDDFNNALNAITSWDIADNLGSEPAISSQVSDSHHSGMLNVNQHQGVDPFPVSGFDGADIFGNHQPDYSLPDSANHYHQQPDYLQSAGHRDSYHCDVTGQHEHHSLSVANQPDVMSCSSQTDSCPYVTINNNGLVYKKTTPDSSYSDWVGRINGRSVYNTSDHYLGYAGTDGKVYDNHDHCVGWVHGCHVYNKGGIEVYETTKGVVGAAAYLLCVYYGGVT